MSRPLKAVIAVEALPRHQMTSSFFSWGLRGTLAGRPLDPFLNLDDFHMSQPTFPPHPHAGFSAVTYLFEDSPGAFRNRDSSGNDQLIPAGAIHWTETASGVVHEEVPVTPGVYSHGLQMFVNLPVKRHQSSPRALHLDPKEIVEVRPSSGTRVRVLAGAVDGKASLLSVVPALTFLDVHLAPHAEFLLPAHAGQTAFALAISGRGVAAMQSLGAHEAALFDTSDGLVRLSTSDQSLQALVGVGTPLGQPIVWSGSFALSSQEAIVDARQRYVSGAMGRLDPSF
jgi:redox-sensitive bicupin YhaK (pirin superfamily)